MTHIRNRWPDRARHTRNRMKMLGRFLRGALIHHIEEPNNAVSLENIRRTCVKAVDDFNATCREFSQPVSAQLHDDNAITLMVTARADYDALAYGPPRAIIDFRVYHDGVSGNEATTGKSDPLSSGVMTRRDTFVCDTCAVRE